MTLFDIVVMILRVWALYNQSRFILRALLTFYAIEVIVNLVYCVFFNTPNQLMGM